MKKNLILTLSLLHIVMLQAQDFEGTLRYECKTNIHMKKEMNFKVENPDKKGDSLDITLNDSTLYKRLKRKGTIVDSIKIIFGKEKFRKTYYKEEPLEYIFDFAEGEKITHTPKYHCIDTTSIKLVDYKTKVEIIESDSTYIVNGLECKKLKVNMSNYYFADIYYTASEYSNLADVFLYEINNNILFQNLYFLKDILLYKKVVKLHYYSKPNAIDFEYILSSITEKPFVEDDFSLPKYEYCYWDTLDDKKLMRKHRKKKRLKEKGKQ